MKDHLGNVRESFKSSNYAAVNEKNFYYPFGLTVRLTTPGDPNKYLYNPDKKYIGTGSKELEVGAKQKSWFFDGYHGVYPDKRSIIGSARFYDPALGRWHTMDPADEFNSPYNYCSNNPIKYTDPDGCVVELEGSKENQQKILQGNADSQLKLSILDNKLVCEDLNDDDYKKLSFDDKYLYNAIKDETIVIKLLLTDYGYAEFNGQEMTTNVAGFCGSMITDRGNERHPLLTIAYQFFNMNTFNYLQGPMQFPTEKIVKHEIIEAYVGAKLDPGVLDFTKLGTSIWQPMHNSAYYQAHAVTVNIYADVVPPGVEDGNGNYFLINQKLNVNWPIKIGK